MKLRDFSNSTQLCSSIGKKKKKKKVNCLIDPNLGIDRVGWLDSSTNSVNMNLSNVWERVKDWEA